MKNLYNFIEYLNEGLIKTTEPAEAIFYIKNSFDNSPYILKEIKEQQSRPGILQLTVSYINKIFDIQHFVDFVNSLTNTHGYFINTLYITNTLEMENKFKYDSNTVNLILNNKSNIKKIVFLLESKFTQEETLPVKLYHLSIESHKNKILKNGLSPKSKSKLSYHPNRVYLTKDPYKCEDLIIPMKGAYYLDFNKYKNYDFIIYEIDTNNLNIKLYNDPNFDGGYFTQSNIPPENISIFKTINF